MNIVRTSRVFFARRPWAYWVIVAALALAVGAGVRSRLAAVDAARDRWEDTTEVWVASADHAPGDPIAATRIEIPELAVPSGVVSRVDPAAIARQFVAAGEMLVAADVAVIAGPAAAADDGTVVVAISDPLVPSAPIGVAVAVYAEGMVLAADARVVAAADSVLFVAVDRADGPIVAAAAQLRTASIAFTR